MKKDETRFTIRFNPIDPRHQAAMTALTSSGRRKASLIAEAVCEYMARHGGGAAFPYIPPPPSVTVPVHSINEAADAADTTMPGASDVASFDDDMLEAVLGGLSAFKL